MPSPYQGFLWRENEESMFWCFHPLADKTNNEHLPKPFLMVIRKSLYIAENCLFSTIFYIKSVLYSYFNFPVTHFVFDTCHKTFFFSKGKLPYWVMFSFTRFSKFFSVIYFTFGKIFRNIIIQLRCDLSITWQSKDYLFSWRTFHFIISRCSWVEQV